MAARYFRRRWSESRGDEFAAWGAAVYYFEVDEDGWPLRQIQVYDSGPRLRYGPGHEEDKYGLLGQAQLDELEDWEPWAIPEVEFRQAWQEEDHESCGD